jgi:hypothetical protein
MIGSHGMAVRLRIKQWDDPRFDWRSRALRANARAPAIPPEDAIQGAAMTKGKNTAAKAQSAATRTVQPKPQARKAKSKLEQLETMLRRPDGATVEQISKVLHWQTHSVRGAMSGALKKKQGLTITSEKTQDGRRIYRIAA